MPLKCIIPAEATNCHRPDKRLICGIWNCYCYRVFQLSVCPSVRLPVLSLCVLPALRILCPFIICHVVNLPPALIVLLPLLWVLGVNVTVDSVSAPAHQLPAMRLPHPFCLSTSAQAFQTVPVPRPLPFMALYVLRTLYKESKPCVIFLLSHC